MSATILPFQQDYKDGMNLTLWKVSSSKTISSFQPFRVQRPAPGPQSSKSVLLSSSSSHTHITLARWFPRTSKPGNSFVLAKDLLYTLTILYLSFSLFTLGNGSAMSTGIQPKACLTQNRFSTY